MKVGWGGWEEVRASKLKSGPLSAENSRGTRQIEGEKRFWEFEAGREEAGRWRGGGGGGGGVCRSCLPAPGFGRCEGTAQSCFRWSLTSSSSVYSDGSSPGFSNRPT